MLNLGARQISMNFVSKGLPSNALHRIIDRSKEPNCSEISYRNIVPPRSMLQINFEGRAPSTYQYHIFTFQLNR
jgi:hypothetical protein